MSDTNKVEPTKKVRDGLSDDGTWNKETKTQLLKEYDSMRTALSLRSPQINSGASTSSNGNGTTMNNRNNGDEKSYKFDSNTPIYRGIKMKMWNNGLQL